MNLSTPKDYLHLSDIDRQVFQKLDLIKALREAKETPFDELLQAIYIHRNKFMCKFGESPTTVFLGQRQMKTFDYIPPYRVTVSQEEKAMQGCTTIQGLEVVQVLRDDFLQVA